MCKSCKVRSASQRFTRARVLSFPNANKKGVLQSLYIYTPMAFACNEAQENCSKYFPMNATGHVEEILTLIFFRLFMAFLSLKHTYKDLSTHFV